MSKTQTLIAKAYAAFNQRDIDDSEVWRVTPTPASEAHLVTETRAEPGCQTLILVTIACHAEGRGPR
jgi:hypothetical protein